MEYANVYQVQYERQLRRAKEEQEEINELLTLGLIRKMRNPTVIQPSATYESVYATTYDYVYQVQYERQLRRAKEEQEEINELLTLGLIRKMLERERTNI
jgi:hypothetical protein